MFPIAKKPLVIKKTTVTVRRSQQITPASTPPQPARKKTLSRTKPTRAETSKTSRSAWDSPATSAKRKTQRPASSTPDFGADDDDESDGDDDYSLEDRTKRQKLDPLRTALPKRNVRSAAAFEGGGEALTIVHAAEIPTLDKTTKYEPVFKGLSQGFEVQVQYPSASKTERYVDPRFPGEC